MSVAAVIRIVNQMVSDGVVELYAIGGAVGATFYLEPAATLDIDFFVLFRSEPNKLVSLQPIFDYLVAHGGVIEGEHVVIAGWPVQFLPPTSPLVEEALREAVVVDVDGAPARVFTPEHLSAVALQTGRAKDKARLLQFVESGVLDMPRFVDILSKHGLLDRWHAFRSTFLDDQS